MSTDLSTECRNPRAGAWLAVLLTLIWIVPGLFGHEPWKPDEGYTIGLVKNVVESGDWVVPRVGDAPFMEKPPIFFITTALIARVVPDEILPLHQAMALAAALYVALMFLFTWLAGREAAGRTTAAFAACMGLMGCVGLLVRAHSAITDVALWCGFAVAVYGMILSSRRHLAGAFWFGTGSGLAFMAKGFFGPAFLGVAALLLPLACREKRRPGYLGFLLLALLFASPWLTIWPAALYKQSPDLFFVWLMDNNLGRFLGPEFGYPRLADVGTPWKYLLMFPWFTLPLWPMAILAWLRQGRAGLAKAGMAYPTLIVLAGMALLSAADTRRDLYLIPILMPLAVVAGQAGESLPRWLDVALRRIPAIAFCAGGVAVWVVWAAWRLGVPRALGEAVERRAPGVDPGLAPAWLALALFLTVFCLWLLAKSRFRREWGWVWAGGMALVWGASMALYLPILAVTRSYQPVFQAMLEQVPAARTAAIDCVLMGETQRSILDYYFDVRPQDTAPGAEDAPYALVQGLRTAAVHAPDPGGWELVWEGARPGDRREIYRLYRRRDEAAEK